jgi:ribosomal protein S18 acetylase RimI-like enzyme
MNAAGERLAFVIIRDINDTHGNVCLKRIAVVVPGQGIGSRFLRMVVRWVFQRTDAYRLWLDALADNARARHVYVSHGFVEEGRLRSAHKLMDESPIDLILMSLLRPDWQLRIGQELDYAPPADAAGEVYPSFAWVFADPPEFRGGPAC